MLYAIIWFILVYQDTKANKHIFISKSIPEGKQTNKCNKNVLWQIIIWASKDSLVSTEIEQFYSCIYVEKKKTPFY